MRLALGSQAFLGENKWPGGAALLCFFLLLLHALSLPHNCASTIIVLMSSIFAIASHAGRSRSSGEQESICSKTRSLDSPDGWGVLPGWPAVWMPFQGGSKLHSTLPVATLLIWCLAFPRTEFCSLALWICPRVSNFSSYSDKVGRISLSCCCCCSAAKSCPTLWDPMDYSTPDSSVLHHLLGFAQIHVHWVHDGIWPSHPLPASSPAFNLSQHQGLFQWVGSSHHAAKVSELQLQHQSVWEGKH